MTDYVEYISDMKFETSNYSKAKRKRNIKAQRRSWNDGLNKGPSYTPGLLSDDLASIIVEIEYNCSRVRQREVFTAHLVASDKESNAIKRRARNRSLLCHTMKTETLPNFQCALNITEGLGIKIGDSKSKVNPLLSPRMTPDQHRHFEMRRRQSFLDLNE